jgi:hypothetical protein
LYAPCNDLANVTFLLVQGAFVTAYRLHLQQMRLMHSLLAIHTASARGLLTNFEQDEQQGDNALATATGNHVAVHAITTKRLKF